LGRHELRRTCETVVFFEEKRFGVESSVRREDIAASASATWHSSTRGSDAEQCRQAEKHAEEHDEQKSARGEISPRTLVGMQSRGRPAAGHTIGALWRPYPRGYDIGTTPRCTDTRRQDIVMPRHRDATRRHRDATRRHRRRYATPRHGDNIATPRHRDAAPRHDISTPRDDIATPRDDIATPRHDIGTRRHATTSQRHATTSSTLRDTTTWRQHRGAPTSRRNATRRHRDATTSRRHATPRHES
jgi:hypothetical protein